ncbi:hypothetical protein Nepgr_014800 [Nepenthes gracilis]|uniref:Uncharacterized protein n=1 Tax=Nepenthes gracilis TaxID=150966 RepID=A0AAD3XQH3_NEPGR|nr:hypothetical protein Nepgr_014800 [Nepenthes gracilis]
MAIVGSNYCNCCPNVYAKLHDISQFRVRAILLDSDEIDSFHSAFGTTLQIGSCQPAPDSAPGIAAAEHKVPVLVDHSDVPNIPQVEDVRVKSISLTPCHCAVSDLDAGSSGVSTKVEIEDTPVVGSTLSTQAAPADQHGKDPDRAQIVLGNPMFDLVQIEGFHEK